MSSCDTDDLIAQIMANIKAKNETFQETIEQLARLHALAKVYSQLMPTAHMLRNRPKCLPRAQVVRVTEMVKFAYGAKEYKNPVEARRAGMRQLDCNALKFCGLAFRIRDIVKLSDLEFEMLVEHVTEFIHSRSLIEHLCSDEITKALVTKALVNEKYQQFLIGNFNRADHGPMD